MTLKLGKAAPDPSKPALRLADHLTGVPVPPAQRDWLSKVTSWPMYKNDALGDCVWAMIGHAIQAWTTYATGTTVVVPVEALLKGYHDVTGWTPSDPSSDRGTVVQDAMSYWRKVGLAGHKILAFAKVNHRDPNELKAAIDIFGVLLVGIQFPRVAMDQFNAGQAWSVVLDDGGIEGGHAIHVGKYDPAEYWLTTWAKVQPMTEGFADHYVDEAWVVITPEWLNSVGQSPDGLDLHSLGEALSALTGEPNPFPPSPPPADPDHAFAAVLHPWLAKRHYLSCKTVANAAKNWLAQRGL